MFKKILFLLGTPERKQAVYLLTMMSITAILDVIGVASILPFIAVLTNINLIENNNILNTIFEISNFFGIKTKEDFIFF